MDSQLRSKRLRWYGHVCRMLDSRLPKVMLFGQVKGCNRYSYYYISQVGHSCFVLELMAGSDNHSDAYFNQPSDF